jgi:hypothetical protein
MGVLIIFAEFSGISYSFVDSSIASFSMDRSLRFSKVKTRSLKNRARLTAKGGTVSHEQDPPRPLE